MPAKTSSTPSNAALASGEVTPAAAADLPLSQSAARRVTRWLMGHFGAKMEAATAGTVFDPALLCAMICQETAAYWLPILNKLEQQPEYANDPGVLADVILARCVLDASGDHPDSPRSGFPKNTAAFRERYESEFTRMLIAEANKTRAMRGYGPKEWVYKGYGIFQYDLQFVLGDEAFFRERQWYDFDRCLEKCMGELKGKYNITRDLWEAVRAYNGAGSRARAYRDKVRAFYVWTSDEISKLPAAATPPAPAPVPVAPAPVSPAPATPPRPPAKKVAVPAAGGNSSFVPGYTPRMNQADLAAKLAAYNIDRTTYPLVVVGIRGYFRDTMGVPGVNDRGMYDDAIFIDSPDGFASFNGNTDPSRYRKGYGFNNATKGIAKLKPGVWYAHKMDFHGSKNGAYRAICQRMGKVVVTRDGNPPYDDEGMYGINIHRGGYQGTSSLGCQTIHPDQWNSFITLAVDLAKRYYGGKWDETIIPYVLIEA